MSLQKYVQQLKPIQENKINYVERVQDLYEATLSKADINKRDNFKVFKDIIDNQKPLKTTKGDVSISWVDNQYKIAYDKGDLDAAFPRGTRVFISSKGDKLKLSDIEKTDTFGGGKGSGGGSSGTTAGESSQCVYLQTIWNNPKTDFNEVELTQAFSQVKVNGTLDMLLNLSEDWVTSSIESAKLLYRILPKRNYTFHRGSDDFVKGVIEKTFSQTGQTDFPDINKWNPADIWIVDESKISSYDFNQVKELPYYNQLLLQAYKNRDIIGVSLKKTKKARFTQQNYKKPFKEPRFTKTTLGKRDFFKSKDGYMFFSEGEIQFRTFPAFQGEIIGKVAKHGKISGDGGSSGPIGIVMKKVGAKPIPPRKDVTRMIKSNYNNFMKLFYNEYLRAGQKNIPLKQFEQNFKGKDSGYLESKYLVTLMFNEIKGREQKFLSLAFRYAKSISANSSVHLKVF
tara:strand:+ start:21 stop:1385 length:1365 start_codon:yes stop_codon:yes gene_type:complete